MVQVASHAMSCRVARAAEDAGFVGHQHLWLQGWVCS
jgi:hypothetical protein